MVAKVLTWVSNPNPVRTLDPSDESVAAMSPSASLLWITGHIGGEDTAATVRTPPRECGGCSGESDLGLPLANRFLMKFAILNDGQEIGRILKQPDVLHRVSCYE